MKTTTFARFAFVAAALAATPALAHVGAGAGSASGFFAGFGHPLFGADHLIAMVTVGLWAGLVGGMALWAWPLAFVCVMAAGGILGIGGIAIPFVEPAILASVVALGVLAALAVRAPVGLGAVLIGGFALFHGHAHGTEIPGSAVGVTYLAGFAVATMLLIGVGLASVTVARRFGMAALVARALGGLAALGGAALVLG